MAGIHAAIAGAGAPADIPIEIGEVFAVWDNISSTPDNTSSIKYVKLTANDAYNSGLLSNEVVSGSQPTLTATAQVVSGPLSGQTVRLINTERSFLRGGSSGTFETDAEQTHSHDVSRNGSTNSRFGQGSGTTVNRNDLWSISINSADSGNRGNETRPKNVGTTYYMRIV